MEQDRGAGSTAFGCGRGSDSNRPAKVGNESRSALTSIAAVALAAAGALVPLPARADCTLENTTVTCDGDLSANGASRSGSIGTVIIRNLTANIGRGGANFQNTAGGDMVIDADFGSYAIVLNSTSTSTSAANGFHVRTEGALSGTIIGDISGPTRFDAPTSSFVYNNFGALALEGGTGVDFTHIGDIDVTRGDLVRDDEYIVDGALGRFGAVRIESDIGDVNFANTGDIIIDGGHRIITSTSDLAAARALQYSNGFTEHHGFYGQAAGTMTFHQTGNIVTTGGDATATATSEGDDGVAEASADPSSNVGIYIPVLSGTTSARTVRTEIVVDGNISITGGDLTATGTATADDPGDGSHMASAIINRLILFGNSTSAGAVGVTNGAIIDFSMTGDIAVNASSASSTAFARAFDTTTPFGFVYAEARGQYAYGIHVGTSSTTNATTENSFAFAGDMTVVGGDGSGEASGTGIARVNRLSFNSTSYTPTLPLTVSGGGAAGINLYGHHIAADIAGTFDIRGGNATGTLTGNGIGTNRVATISGGDANGIGLNARDTLDIDLDVDMVTRGGDATGTLNGDGLAMTVTAGSGRAWELSYGLEPDFDFDQKVEAHGGDAQITATGDGSIATARAGGASGIQVQSSGNPGNIFTQISDILVTGGDAEGTAGSGIDLRVRGGGATGATQVISGRVEGATGGTATFVNEGTITALGGNATRNGSGTVDSIGGGAVGIYGLNFIAIGIDTPLIDHRGAIIATAGTGPDRMGEAQGIYVLDIGFPDFGPNASIVPANFNVDVSGTILATGESMDQVLAGTGTSTGFAGGVVAQMVGTADIAVSGRIDTTGSHMHGIHGMSGRNQISVSGGGIVRADGQDAHGVRLRAAYGETYVIEDGEYIYIQSPASDNSVTVQLGGLIESTHGAAIFDDGSAIISEYDTTTQSWVSVTVDRENATYVDIAGIVTGGSGIAMSLGSGADELLNRATGIINGDVLMGSGVDRFTARTGSTLNGDLDLGAGNDLAVIEGGAIITGDFLGGDGDDTVRISDDHGIVGDILLGAGSDTFLLDQLSSTVAADGGAGNDTALYTTAEDEDAVVDLTAYAFTSFETFAQDGPGTLTLADTGSIFDNYEVRGGTFVMNVTNSDLNVIVGSGGTLRGNGSMSDLTVNGLVAPGNSIGTLYVADVTFNAGSTYEVEIAAPDQSDLIVASGTATINGGALAIETLDPDEDYTEGQTYRILSAGSIVRTSDFTLNQPLSLLSTEVVYGTGFVDLLLTADIPFPTLAETYNQMQASAGLQDLEQSGESQIVFNEILQVSLGADGPAAVRRAFDLSSGEIHASGQHVIDQTFALFSGALGSNGATGRPEAVTTPLGYGAGSRHGPGIVAIDEAIDSLGLPQGTAAWLAPMGGRGTVRADGNAAQLDWSAAGLAGGYETAIETGTGSAFGGVALGYARSHAAVAARQSTLDVDGFYAGIYGGWADGPWAVDGAVSVAANHTSTERRVSFGGIDETATADYWSQAVRLTGEVAYGFELDAQSTVSPLFTLDAGWSGHGGFTETGAGALNLTGAAENWTRFDAGIGLAITHVMLTEHGEVTLDGRLVWEHAFADVVPSQTLAFAGSPTGFEVRGPDAGRDRLRLGLGVSLEATDDISIRAGYEGVFSGGQDTHAIRFGVNVRF